jgi:hypothetical protein
MHCSEAAIYDLSVKILHLLLLLGIAQLRHLDVGSSLHLPLRRRVSSPFFLRSDIISHLGSRRRSARGVGKT